MRKYLNNATPLPDLKVVFLLFLFFLTPMTAFASAHYSYEHAEELKPLIFWRDYGNVAFNEAIVENKPVFLLLTAPTWCYWCQVYESEEYLFHPAVIKELNEKFIPVYVDADARQDLTRQYLEGGWPSTTVLAPNKDRLYGFSGVRPVENMIANLEQAVAYTNTRGFLNREQYSYQKTKGVIPREEDLTLFIQSYENTILRAYDPVYGGFGSRQKFPQGRTLDYALDLYEETGDAKWLTLVQTTLDNQYTDSENLETDYRLFDPIEGGFHRYGTQIDWSPPHFEKMLYDNARLLQAYQHLLLVDPGNETAQEVVKKTRAFIEKNWWDEELGGFYSNSDVHGEDHYYGKNPRLLPPPRVEKTKYADWKSDAMVSYTLLWQRTEDDEYRIKAEKSLDFFAKTMVTKNGAYHYYKPDGSIGISGNLLDNAHLLRAFVEGYIAFDNEEYLATAQRLADYSLESLYDWYGGGFFERNSLDIDAYAGDHIILSKPSEENGIIAYSLLLLYLENEDPRYLLAGMRTLGFGISHAEPLDRGYYHAKAAKLVLEHDLLGAFALIQNELEQIEKEQQASFWVNALIAPSGPRGEFIPSTQGLEMLKGSLIVLIIIALLAGFLSFTSPCTLPILPAYIAHTFTARGRIKSMTITFFMGLIGVFTLLGMSASVVGSFLRTHISLFLQIAGGAIIIFGIMALLGKGLPSVNIRKNKPTGYISSFLFGSALGIGWTPCVGPILVSILLLAATTGSVLRGGVLLAFYGIGLAIPLLVLSTMLARVNKKHIVWRLIVGREFQIPFGKRIFTIHSSALVSGVLFILLGSLIFSGALFTFNQYLTTTSVQKWLFGIEEWLLGLVG